MRTIQANTYITLANVNKPKSWEQLLAAVKEATAVEPVCVNFAFVQLSEPNLYLTELLMNDRVTIECIKSNTTHMVLHSAAIVVLHDNKKIAEKFKFQTIEASKTLSKKELEIRQRFNKYKAAINATIDAKGAGRTSIFVTLADLTKDCGLNFATNKNGISDFFNILRDILVERGIKEIMISMRNIAYKENLITSYLRTAIRICKEHDIKITFTDCSEELNSKLRLHMKLTYNNGAPEDVLNFIKQLGIGRVVLLTKLKDRNTENTDYREEDEVIAQFIAIIRQISTDAIEFKYTGFGAMPTFHDLLAQYGSPDEFDDKLIMHIVNIPIADLGCTDIRIAKGWHLNLLNGDVDSSGEFNYISTYTSETIKALAQPEEVVLPEFIRRSFRSWHESFNERAMLVDIQNFKKKCKRKH